MTGENADICFKYTGETLAGAPLYLKGQKRRKEDSNECWCPDKLVKAQPQKRSCISGQES